MKSFVWGMLIVILMIGLVPTSVVSAQSTVNTEQLFGNQPENGQTSLTGGVFPTPWFMTVAAYVRIYGEPAKPETRVEFYCRENLAGYGQTYDYNEEYKGILGFTHIYGSDLSAQPQILACEEGDLLKIYVDGMRAVYSPEIRWTNDPLAAPIITLSQDTEAKFIFSRGETVAAVGRLNILSSLRTWSVEGTFRDDLIGGVPFWRNFPNGSVKSYHVTDKWGRTYLYAMHDATVCDLGPDFFLVKGDGGVIKAGINNTSSEDVQIILKLGSNSGPSGRLASFGGSFEVLTSEEVGAIEVRLLDETGPICSTMEWDFRYLPEPRLTSVTRENKEKRVVNLQGDNLFLFEGVDFDPKQLLVTFVRSSGKTVMTFDYDMVVGELGGVWNVRDINIPLPDSFPAGKYEVFVSVVNGVSNTMSVNISGGSEKNHVVFLPFIGK